MLDIYFLISNIKHEYLLFIFQVFQNKIYITEKQQAINFILGKYFPK